MTADPALLRRVADRALADYRGGVLPAHWGDAILMLALDRAADALAEPSYAEGARDWLDEYLGPGLDLSRPIWDWGALPLPALALHRRRSEERYLALALQVCDHLVSGARRTADGGGVAHGGPPQLWVDSMFFSAPALVEMSALHGEPHYLEEAVREIEVHARHLLDRDSGLFYHMWDETSGRHTPCLWARGNAWAALSTLAVLAALPADDWRRPGLQAMLRRQMDAVVARQDASGRWHTVIDRPDSYLETSCAAMFCLAIVRGARSGWLPESMLGSAHRAWTAVVEQVDLEGRVTGVSAGTPPGDFDIYQRVPLGTETFGTGFALMAGMEMAPAAPRA